MTVDGFTREYTWEDILCLVLRDLGLDPKDRAHRTIWYLGSFQEPNHGKDACLRVTKYEQDFDARLKEHLRDKL